MSGVAQGGQRTHFTICWNVATVGIYCSENLGAPGRYCLQIEETFPLLGAFVSTVGMIRIDVDCIDREKPNKPCRTSLRYLSWLQVVESPNKLQKDARRATLSKGGARSKAVKLSAQPCFVETERLGL